jgi:arabinogalactan endo-1,4-beta-galactosidase
MKSFLGRGGRLTTVVLLLNLVSCKRAELQPLDMPGLAGQTEAGFYFGADLSYVNQVLDHKGVYKDQGLSKNPYHIFKEKGANLARFRLWHTPTWTKEVMEPGAAQMYIDLADIEKGMRLAKDLGMDLMLDFHYSDVWADPKNQKVPQAWSEIKELAVLNDSIYQYTYNTLRYLDSKGLMPQLVQIGNENDCGLFYTDTPPGFPSADACKGNWSALGSLLNSGIKAVRDVAASSAVQTKIALHVANPDHVEWWFDKITSAGGVSDFDIIGFSYYPLWHTAIHPSHLPGYITSFKNKYRKEVILLETAYPWTLEGNDSYANVFDSNYKDQWYPFSEQGQYQYMVELTQHVMDAGGIGVIYWEPGWITSDMKDLWGTGSLWENAAFFDFEGNTLQGIDYMKYDYRKTDVLQ